MSKNAILATNDPTALESLAARAGNSHTLDDFAGALKNSTCTNPIKIMRSAKCRDFDVESRLYELQELKDGWYDGEQGSQLSKDGIAWLAQSWRYFSH